MVIDDCAQACDVDDDLRQTLEKQHQAFCDFHAEFTGVGCADFHDGALRQATIWEFRATAVVLTKSPCTVP